MKRRLFGPGSDNSAAVAPTVALSLFALIGAGGIAFDYARMAALDTELQIAADQAALAAATQLDQTTGSCARAATAAENLVAHQTIFANETGNRAITVFLRDNNGAPIPELGCDATGNVRFYQDKAKTTAATADSNANFVEVWVNGRTANFALTPVVAAFSSGSLAAAAYAGLGSAICKVPPFFMCPPAGVGLDPDNWKGQGFKLFDKGASWAPGNYGYLDVGAANNGTPDQRVALAFDGAALECISGEGSADVDTGVSASVPEVLNVRFDVFSSSWSESNCYPSSNCSTAFNTTKDLIWDTGETISVANCGIPGNPNNSNKEWHLPSAANQYFPTNDSGDDATVSHMGYPMDVCHYPGRTACTNGRLGDGSWRRDIYFKTNHPNLSDGTGSNWQTQTGLSANATRYDFYNWEQAGTGVNRPDVTSGTSRQTGVPICKPSGIKAGPNQPDRRVIAMAVATNCGSLGGANTPITIGSWAEVFLVQPMVKRDQADTEATDIYVEIIGEAEPSGDGTNAQLVKRDVPYLIE